MVDLELAVALLGVETPDDVPLHVAADEIAGAEERVYVLAVGAGTGGGLIPFIILEVLFAGADARLPDLLAVCGAQADKDDVIAVLAGDEDAVAPYGRRRAPHPRQRHVPGKVFLHGPMRRQLGFAADAVASRAAPLRPVFGVRQTGDRREGQPKQQQSAIHAVSFSLVSRTRKRRVLTSSLAG